MLEIYVICWDETQEPLTPASFKKYWPNYGSNSLHGWTPPKKVYYSIGNARRGFAHIPDEIKSKVSIYQTKELEKVQNGSELAEKQKVAKIKKEKAAEMRYARYEKEKAEKVIEDMKKRINDITERTSHSRYCDVIVGGSKRKCCNCDGGDWVMGRRGARQLGSYDS